MNHPTLQAQPQRDSRRSIIAMLAAPLLALAPTARAGAARPTLRVGPGRAIKTLAEASRLAPDGATVEVDAGSYRADVAVWSQRDLALRAVGGRVRLVAEGAAAEGKAIWVVRSAQMQVDGFDFEGAAVGGRNGAGIRFEAGRLRVRDCSFTGNEMGLLTNNDPNAVLEIEASEFAHNLRPDGHNHNLYVGGIARLSVRSSYFHHAHSGHLLKSRAAHNHIFYNRLTDEPGGTASYELEFANGGVACVVGNLIEQSAATENPHLVSFGAEGYPWPRNALFLVNNTLVDRRPAGGIFLRVRQGASVPVRAVNNLLVGSARLEDAGDGDYRANVHVGLDDLADAARADYRLRARSPALGQAVDPGDADGCTLAPSHEYQHPRRLRPLAARAAHPGALQGTAASRG